MIVPDSLLQVYRYEYQSTDITLDELCKKYSITKNDIPESSDWIKQELVIESEIEPDIKESILKKVDEFKVHAMDLALEFIKNEGRFAEVRDIKNMVTIVNTIETSFKDVKSDNTVNVAIQSIVKEFSNDC